jgi:hypothetical protein
LLCRDWVDRTKQLVVNTLCMTFGGNPFPETNSRLIGE